MPSPCVLPACKGNYNNGPKVSVCSFPSDENLKNKWIRAIKRENFIPTKYSKIKVAKTKEKEEIQEEPERDSNQQKIFNLKRTRYEIMRFAVNGFDKERRTQDKIAMAIRLGAKPPKREYKNYRELMEEKLKEKSLKKAELQNKYTIQKLKGRKKTKQKKKKGQPSNIF